MQCFVLCTYYGDGPIRNGVSEWIELDNEWKELEYEWKELDELLVYKYDLIRGCLVYEVVVYNGY